MFRRPRTFIVLVFVSALMLAASSCLPSNDPFRSAAFPTPQASLFSIPGFRGESPFTNDSPGEFTLVSFEQMVLEGGNRADINIDLSRSPQPVEQYLFVIDRSRHSVTVLNADTQDIPEETGDIHVRVTVELTDPVALAGYVTPDNVVFRFAVQYVPGFVRIVDVTTQTDAVLELNDLAQGTQSTLIQTQLAGLRATFAVDVLDLERDVDDNGLEEDVAPIAREDKPQQPLNLGDSSSGGSVNIVVRLEDEAPPVAVLPPPAEDISQPPPDAPPPQEPVQQPPEAQEPPPDSDGQNNDNASGANDSPSESQTPQQTPTPQPLDPEGEDKVPAKGGDPTEPNVEILIVIDDSSNMLTDDPFNERLEAVRAFLNATLTGDKVGLVRFADTIYHQRRLTSIIHSKGSIIDGGIRTLREDLDREPELTTGLTPTHLGLIRACDVLVDEGELINRMAILISDGVPNVGAEYGSDYFDPVEKCFSDKGWPIYTVGIGNYSVENLEALADVRGGDARYTPRDKMAFLICQVQAIRADYADGASIPCRDEVVYPDQTLRFVVNVPAAQLRASFSLNWIGSESDVELRLVRPDGAVVAGRSFLPFTDVSYDGGTKSGKTLEIYGVELPEAGTWRVEIIPKTVPPEGIEVVFGFSSVPAR